MNESGEQALAELEREVTEKYTAAWRAANPELDSQLEELQREWAPQLDVWAKYCGEPVEGRVLPVGGVVDVPQFPRERWAVYPARRAHALALAGRLIDFGKLAEAGWLIGYGGKERIS